MWFFDVKVKVISQQGECFMGHKVGDEWVIGMTTPLGMCNPALNAIYPYVRVLQLGGEYEYPAGSGVTRLCCPDPYNPVIFELSRVEGSKKKFP